MKLDLPLRLNPHCSKGILLYTYTGFALSLFHLHGNRLYTPYTLLNLALEYLGNPSKSAGVVLIILYWLHNALECEYNVIYSNITVKKYLPPHKNKSLNICPYTLVLC